MSIRYTTALSIVLTLGPLAGATAQIPITVTERAGIARTGEPVTLGVPFAEGALSPGTPVRVTDGSGTPVGAQLAPMAFWGDGSIRWLKCDFQASVAALDEARYEMEIGTAHGAATELDVTESASAITVTTGPLRFEVSKQAFNLFERVWLDIDGDRSYTPDELIVSPGSPGPLVVAGGREYRASNAPPEMIEIEEAGPMKVVVKASGRHTDAGDPLLKYETRITAYAGQPFVRVWHVYANGKSVDNLGNALDPANGQAFDRYAIVLDLALTGGKTVRVGGDAGATTVHALAAGETLALVQADRAGVSEALAWEATAGGGRIAGGSRAEGWGDMSDGRWGMTVASRAFWQKYPKGIALGDDGAVSFEPAPTPEYLWVSQGTGDEILFHFHPAGDAPAAESVSMSLGKSPLLARTSPEQYASAEAFYALHAGPSAIFPDVDAYAREVTTTHLENQDALGLYGNLNFGSVPSYDWAFNPDEIDASGWGGNYYDATLLTPCRLFAQTGDPIFADVFIPAAKHYMETVCWNPYDTESWMSGYAPAYSAYHRASDHFEHHYAEGLWYYYYLTGDERAREVALRGADSIVHRQAWGNENAGCRLAYQRASACIEAFKNTRDVTYLDHAKHLLVDLILDTQDDHGMIGGYFAEGGEGVSGEQTFMMALYSDTLWKLINELAADDPGRQDLVDRLALLADFLDGYARMSPGEHRYWNWWNSPPNGSVEPDPYTEPGNPDSEVYWNAKGLIAGTYAYAYDLTGDVRYRELASELMSHIWLVGPQGSDDGRYLWSKISGQLMKAIPHVVGILDDTATPVLPWGPGGPSPVVASLAVVSARPNPFGARAVFHVALSEAVRARAVSLRVFDVEGRLVRTLPGELRGDSASARSIEWDGRDARGMAVAPGRYFYRLDAARRGDPGRPVGNGPLATGALVRLD